MMGEEQTALVRRTSIPQALMEVGVQVAEDTASGMQIVVIPPAVREKFNVLMPVQAFQQADQSWTPSIRVVQADPDAANGAHFYKQQGNKLAPKKQLLELLGDAAGVISTEVDLIDRERFDVGGVTAETFTHRAVLKIRKSDGTLRMITDSKTYELYAEYEEICDSVKRSDRWENGERAGKFMPGTDEYDAEVRKRWLNEIKFAKAKNESKAILRAIRSALQIPHTFSPADVAKPFIVIGWNFTPDYSDVETRRMLVEAGLFGAQSAASRIYGEPRREIEAPAGELVDEPSGDLADAGAGVAEAVPTSTAQEPVPASPEPEPEPTLEEEPVAETSPFTAPAEAEEDPAVIKAKAAALVVIPVGTFKELALAKFHEEKGDRAVSWFRWALRNVDDTFGTGEGVEEKLRLAPGVFRTAVWDYCQVFLPELVEQVKLELAPAA
jgi:hypothetical protein